MPLTRPKDHGYNPNCGSNSNTPPPQEIIRYTIVNVPSKYGALASNKKTGGVGGAINMNSLAEAKREAIKRCENGGKNAPCRVITWVRNGCFAGAVSAKNKLYRETGEPGVAEKLALSRCEASGEGACEIAIPEACSIP